MFTFRPIALAALAAAGLGLSATAHAESVEVRFADLDLTTETGRAELAKRVDRAASRACSDIRDTGTNMVNRAAIENCRASVRDQVNARLARRTAAETYGR